MERRRHPALLRGHFALISNQEAARGKGRPGTQEVEGVGKLSFLNEIRVKKSFANVIVNTLLTDTENEGKSSCLLF